jgi:hypothetical protein
MLGKTFEIVLGGFGDMLIEHKILQGIPFSEIP